MFMAYDLRDLRLMAVAAARGGGARMSGLLACARAVVAGCVVSYTAAALLLVARPHMYFSFFLLNGTCW